MSAEKRLIELGLTLPEPPAPGGNYVSSKTIGNLVYLSGVISTDTTESSPAPPAPIEPSPRATPQPVPVP